jgi:hypothetical protein
MAESFIDIIAWGIEIGCLMNIEKAVKESNKRCCCCKCRAEEEAAGRDTGISRQNSEWDRDLAKLEADRRERKRISEAEKQNAKKRKAEEWW